MALIDIKKLKQEASKVVQNVGKGINDAAENVANIVSDKAKKVGDSSTQFATNIIAKLLKGLDIDALITATKSYGKQHGKNVDSTLQFLNNLKTIRDGK